MLRLSSIFWQLLPKLRFVQFPWRWMSILTIPFLYFLAVTFPSRRFRWLCVIAFVALNAGTAVFLVQHTWWDDEEFPTLRATIASGEGFDGTDEYDPVGDDHYNLAQKAPLAQLLPDQNLSSQAATSTAVPRGVVVERWTPERKIVRVELSQPVRLALRLLNYPAWQVELNGSRIQPEQSDDSGQMIIPLPPGASRVTARFIRTPDRTVGVTISVLSALVAILLVLSGNRRREKDVA